MLTAGGGTSYIWSNSSTANTIMITPTVNTTYSVSSTNNGCTGVDSVQITVADCTGLKQFSNNNQNMRCNPNPAKDYLDIELPNGEGQYTVTLMNLLGEVVMKQNKEFTKRNGKQRINLNNIAKGIYLLTVNNSTQEFKARIAVEQ
jgi:hypothetical protein